MRKSSAAAVTASIVLLTGCSSHPADEGDALDACRDRLSAGEAAGLRMTVADNGPGQWLVKLWTDTPKGAGSPVGEPNIVCSASAQGDSIVIDAFARTRQDRNIAPKALCGQLLPLLDAVTADMTSGRDAGPDLVLVRRRLPEPLPQQPAQLADALRRLNEEVAPAAKASETGSLGINEGDFYDWPGLVARVKHGCQTV